MKGHCHICGAKAPPDLWPVASDKGWAVSEDRPRAWAQGFQHVTLTCPECLDPHPDEAPDFNTEFPTDATTFVIEAVASGPCRMTELTEAAKADGISFEELQAAYKALNVERSKRAGHIYIGLSSTERGAGINERVRT